MSQSRKGSAIETAFNIVVGYLINLFANYMILPLFGFEVTMAQTAWIGLCFTFISIARSYLFRRLFNYLGEKGLCK